MNPIESLATDFKAIIFDCDGTLVDSVPAHFAALQRALALLGLTMKPEWYFQRHSMSADDLLLQFEADGLGTIKDKEATLAAHQRLFMTELHLLEEVPSVADIAREYAGRVPMAVASNGHRRNVRATLEAAELLPLFTAVVTREDVANGKPAPDLFVEAARQLGVAPAECIVFEDAPAGIAAATAAGVAHVFDVRKWHTPRWQAGT